MREPHARKLRQMNSYRPFSGPCSCPGAAYCVGCIGGCALSLLGPGDGHRHIDCGGCTICPACAAQPQPPCPALISPCASSLQIPCASAWIGHPADAIVHNHTQGLSPRQQRQQRFSDRTLMLDETVQVRSVHTAVLAYRIPTAASTMCIETGCSRAINQLAGARPGCSMASTERQQVANRTTYSQNGQLGIHYVPRYLQSAAADIEQRRGASKEASGAHHQILCLVKLVRLCAWIAYETTLVKSLGCMHDLVTANSQVLRTLLLHLQS